MKSDSQVPEELLPLTPAVFHILLALFDQDRHGYGIMKEVARLTDGEVRLGPGTLYGSIKRMLTAKLIEEVKEAPLMADQDERRRYYRPTDFGRRVARLEANRLRDLVREARVKRLLPQTEPPNAG